MFEDVIADSSLNELFDTCVTSILEGKAQVSNTREEPGYPTYECFLVNGQEILVDAPLEYYLFKLDNSGFVYEKARDFSDTMRKLCGWQWHVDIILSDWVRKNVLDPFLEQTIDNDGYDHYKLKPGNLLSSCRKIICVLPAILECALSNTVEAKASTRQIISLKWPKQLAVIYP